MGEVMTPAPSNILNPKPTTMDFYDAVKQIMIGKKVTRVIWANKDYCFLENEYLSIFTKGEKHTWLIAQGDVEGQDWVIVKESN